MQVAQIERRAGSAEDMFDELDDDTGTGQREDSSGGKAQPLSFASEPSCDGNENEQKRECVSLAHPHEERLNNFQRPDMRKLTETGGCF